MKLAESYLQLFEGFETKVSVLMKPDHFAGNGSKLERELLSAKEALLGAQLKGNEKAADRFKDKVKELATKLSKERLPKPSEKKKLQKKLKFNQKLLKDAIKIKATDNPRFRGIESTIARLEAELKELE